MGIGRCWTFLWNVADVGASIRSQEREMTQSRFRKEEVEVARAPVKPHLAEEDMTVVSVIHACVCVCVLRGAISLMRL